MLNPVTFGFCIHVVPNFFRPHRDKTQWGSNRGMAHQYTPHYWRACALAGMEPGNALYPHNRYIIPHVVDADVPQESEASTPPEWACPEEYKKASQDWMIEKEVVTA